MNDFKIRLVTVASFSKSISSIDQVVFEVTPRFSESGGVDYNSVTPIHLPGGIQVYQSTKSRTFSIGAKFISRTPEEATQNMLYLQTLRSWRYPYFGASTTLNDQNKLARVAGKNNQDHASQIANPSDRKLSADESNQRAISRSSKQVGVELLGAPPDVLYLFAYSNNTKTDRSNIFPPNINKVPVVLSELSISYPEDVDYIPSHSHGDARESEPFPVRIEVDITLMETHSPREYETFSLQQYKSGMLSNF